MQTYLLCQTLPDWATDFDGLARVDLHVTALGSELFPDQPVAVLGVDDDAFARFKLALGLFVALVVPVLKSKRRLVKLQCSQKKLGF